MVQSVTIYIPLSCVFTPVVLDPLTRRYSFGTVDQLEPASDYLFSIFRWMIFPVEKKTFEKKNEHATYDV
jgi:hypothetical protein